MKAIATILILLPVGFLLGGCPAHIPITVEGQCSEVFTDPGFAVQGQRIQDKRWIGATQEKGIEICGWKRPKFRPTVVAATQPPKPALLPSAPPAVEQQSAPAPVILKKKHWYDRFRKQAK